jgi:hypothetical protein
MCVIATSPNMATMRIFVNVRQKLTNLEGFSQKQIRHQWRNTNVCVTRNFCTGKLGFIEAAVNFWLFSVLQKCICSTDMHIGVHHKHLGYSADTPNDHKAVLRARRAKLNENLRHKDALLKEK